MIAFVFAVILAIYLWRVNWVMWSVPSKARGIVKQVTEAETRSTAARVQAEGINWTSCLPPKRNRRYIVVGGSGLVGGELVLQLLAVGTPPPAIRIVDNQRPSRQELVEGVGAKVPVLLADVTSESSVHDAFSAPWDSAIGGLPLTVFHTAAAIRPQERFEMFYPRVSRVNVGGTATTLSEARKAGADVFVFTSSGQAAMSSTNWFFAPWRREPRNYIKFISEEDFDKPLRRLRDFPTIYSYSKAVSERLVCSADDTSGRGMRTGVVRPSMVVYGHKSDVLGWLISVGKIPAFTGSWAANYVHVRNVAMAEMLMEGALLGEHVDKVAGRPFMVADEGPPLLNRDVYDILSQLSAQGLKVSYPPPLLLLLAAHLVEWYCVLLVWLPVLGRLGLREPGRPLQLFQPATFGSGLSSSADDSQARREPAEGGIGYVPACTTVEGLCALVAELNEDYWDKKRRGLTAGKMQK